MSPIRTIAKHIYWGVGVVCEIGRLLVLGLAMYFLLLAAWGVLSNMFFGDLSEMFSRPEYRMGRLLNIVCGLVLMPLVLTGCLFTGHKFFEGIWRLHKIIEEIPGTKQRK